MNSKIEEVAKAICKASGYDEETFKVTDQWHKSAKAAIKAMREPTNFMRSRGIIAPNSTEIYQSMIDAALEEK